MRPHSQVHVQLESGETVPGLVLKSTSDGGSALVTYEQGGRVVTSWVPLPRLQVPDDLQEEVL